PGIPTFHFDEDQVGQVAFQHLYKIGCRRLGIVGGSVSDRRNQSFLKEARQAGAKVVWTPGQRWIGYLSDVISVLKEMMANSPSLPDGLFCYNELVGLAFLSIAWQRGIRVPDEVAVMACDNTELATYTNPPLSSIDVNIPLLAETAVKKICSLVTGEKMTEKHTIIPVRLVVRESTGRKIRG
ncbi:MAG: substrate-binding domain-containing protein, partial [Candidatus Omnitrophica bacterium]|nr:substrate-binding domain-containing protein [Candidatus Omnitrophota bacterium]